MQHQVKLFGGNRQVFAPPKGSKTRSVPLPSSVANELSAHIARSRSVEVTLPCRALDNAEQASVPLIASTRERTALNRNYFNSSIWKAAQRRASIPSSRDNGTQALRHWYASVLLDAGESIRAVSEYLGHSDPGFTLRTYTHLMPSSAERTRSAVDAVLASEFFDDVQAL